MLFGNKDKKRFKYWCLVVIFVVLGTLRGGQESLNSDESVDLCCL